MRRKPHNPRKKRHAKKARPSFARGRSHRTGGRKRGAALKRTRRRLLFPKSVRQTAIYQKALAVVARMRRDKLSLARAAREEHIKPGTALRYVGNAIQRSGPGKPWKATKSDRLGASMTVLTAQGPTTVIVSGSVERTRLARYDIALRRWRADEDGADKELMAFQGQTVGGHVLITDPDLLIQLEEAGQLDFDTLYFSIGGGA
jgi:hypothetical protein